MSADAIPALLAVAGFFFVLVVYAARELGRASSPKEAIALALGLLIFVAVVLAYGFGLILR